MISEPKHITENDEHKPISVHGSSARSVIPSKRPSSESSTKSLSMEPYMEKIRGLSRKQSTTMKSTCII